MCLYVFFSWEEPESALGNDTLDELMTVDSVPLDPSAHDTLPCSLPGGYSPGPLPEAAAPSSSSRSLSEIDARIAELQFLGCKLSLGWLNVGWIMWSLRGLYQCTSTSMFGICVGIPIQIIN